MPIFYHYLPLVLLLTVAVIASIITQKLTMPGAITGGVVAIMIFSGAGYTGLGMLAAFFILGTVSTAWGKNEKLHIKAKGDQSAERNAAQVLANGGAAAIMGALAYFIPAKTELLTLMMAGSLASATADTLSSELGMIYGRRFYNIITWKRDSRGLDGVVSLEGTLIGLIGSIGISIIYGAGVGWDNKILTVIIAGTIGNSADSVLGALWERKHYLNNDAVNFMNTVVAAVAAGLLGALL